MVSQVTRPLRGPESEVPSEIDVTVLVCTRNRPKDLERLLRSLLADDRATFEIIVVDQSDGHDTAELVAQSFDIDRVHLAKSATVGKGAAMNEGFRLVRTGFVMCTDDDCELSADTVSAMAAELERRPDVAVVFCRVKGAPFDRAVGYIPEFLPRRDRVIRSALRSCRHRGLGAGMAVRVSAVREIDGIDECFGPGAPLGSADDWDLQVRVLMKGWQTFQTDRIEVIHHGFRTHADGQHHSARDWFSLGAVAAKPVRSGRPFMAIMALWILLVDGLGSVVRSSFRLHRVTGGRRLVWFCRGFMKGVSTRVDRPTLSYRQRTGSGRATAT